jgi:ABC-2 type transport system ATP-binding protein
MSPDPSSTPALALAGVSKSFGDKKAVDRLDLEVPAGSIFGLLGPNGAGKSTTIRIALNVYAPDAGTVKVLGEPFSPAASGRIGYLPEERGLYTKMRIGDLLIFMAAIKGMPSHEARPRIDQWLARMELTDWRDRKLQELSKGMQQKIQFIATVLHDPELIVLDEPFSGLDPINTDLLKGIMLDLHQRGRTIIFSTHIMEQAERLCDAICLINGGRKVLEGRLDAIKGRYGRNTVALAFDGDGAFLSTHPLVRSVNRSKSHVELKLSDGADPQVLLHEAVGRVRVTRFEVVEPSLHDIFIERVAETREGQVSAGRMS